MNVDEKHLLELAAQDPMEVPNLFGEVKKALVQLEASAPDRLASAVEAFEAKSTHWPEWTWSTRRPHGVYDVRMVGGRYRSWAGEIYSGQRSAKYGVVRGIASPAENWSKPFSLLNLNAAADDLPGSRACTWTRGAWPRSTSRRGGRRGSGSASATSSSGSSSARRRPRSFASRSSTASRSSASISPRGTPSRSSGRPRTSTRSSRWMCRRFRTR